MPENFFRGCARTVVFAWMRQQRPRPSFASEEGEMKACLYARYSTSKQNEQSLDDQLRTCERLAERNGFEIVARFQDAAVSGGTSQRVGYQKLLEAARRRVFDVIVAEDSSRLWRNLAEQSPRIAELRDLNIHVVTFDLDTRQESSAVLGAVLGAMSETYRGEIGRRTRRGLEGKARSQQPTGGKSYAYETIDGRRQINREQAAVVVRVFEMYRDGFSPRAIADQLNIEGVPSPGASWNRQERRRAGWLGSAIAGDASRGVGILNNEQYRGVTVWNRNRWVRSAADSKRRRCVPNPPTEWVSHIDEGLRIVPEALWRAVKARQRQQAESIGARIAEGLGRQAASRTGRGPKFLLSGLIRCGSCGAAYVIASATSYACASFVNGGGAACSNNVRFRRDAVEAVILENIRRDLATPEAGAEVCRRVRARLRELSQPKPMNRARIAELEAQIANLIDAVAVGGLRGSAGLAERLRAAESELAGLKAQAATTDTGTIERLLPDLVDRYTRTLERLPEVIARDVTRGRAAIASHIGPLTVRTTDTEIQFFRETGHAEAALLRAVGGTSFYGSGGQLWHKRAPALPP
jgi:site-specific DNA recombinase